MSDWKSARDELPEDGAWCWVALRGESVILAIRDRSAIGGWTNADTWEDFDRAVTDWMPVDVPSPPLTAEQRQARMENIAALVVCSAELLAPSADRASERD